MTFITILLDFYISAVSFCFFVVFFSDMSEAIVWEIKLSLDAFCFVYIASICGSSKHLFSKMLVHLFLVEKPCNNYGTVNKIIVFIGHQRKHWSSLQNQPQDWQFRFRSSRSTADVLTAINKRINEAFYGSYISWASLDISMFLTNWNKAGCYTIFPAAVSMGEPSILSSPFFQVGSWSLFWCPAFWRP